MAHRVAACLMAAALFGCLERRDLELVRCHPGCSEEADAGADVDTGEAPQDAGATPDMGVEIDAGFPEDAGVDMPLPDLVPRHPTPNSMTWTWEGIEIPTEVTAFSVRYALTLAGLTEGGGQPWSADQDPNLSGRTSIVSGGPVTETRIRALAPDTAYFARLYGSTPGGEIALAEGEGRTAPEATQSLVLFSDEVGLEVVLERFSVTAESPFQGTAALSMVGTGAELSAGISSLDVLLGEALPMRWSAAYLELYLRTSASLPGVEIDLAGTIDPLAYRYVAIGAGGATWHRIQIPLTAFLQGSEPATTPASLGTAVTGISLVAAWPNGGSVAVDEIAIRF